MMARHPDWLLPDWQVPRVGALMTTRLGGCSAAPFDAMNLKDGLGDAPQAVGANQAALAAATGARHVFLHQVHGAQVIRLRDAELANERPLPQADASITTDAGIACTVLVADCLPVLFVAAGGRAVGAAHAGWRGLARGVLEASVRALCEAAECRPDELQAWLGACIGPRRFEVGADVLQAFGASTDDADHARFRPSAAGKWLADLPLLARDRLQHAGLKRISGGGWCTVEARSRFFSFRRDGITGRMAAAVWIRSAAA